MSYQKIIIALELNDENDNEIIKKAKAVSGNNAELYLVHSVEHLSNYGAAYGVSAGVDVEQILSEEATNAMNEIGDATGIPPSHRVVKVGPAKFVILEEAEKLHADLIVVGSHGRHGMRLLLGSTANAVLHSAKCDVLAVRVRD